MKTVYEYATKSWPVVKGCDESLPCAARCWAKRQVHRLAGNPNEEVAEFHRGLVETIPAPLCGMPGDFESARLAWTGKVKLNEPHLADPLRWRRPQVVAVGYHGDIALLSDDQIRLVMSISASASEMYGHAMLFLTKRPGVLRRVMLESEWRIGLGFGAPGCEKHILPAWLERKDESGGKPHPKQVMPNLWFGVSFTNQADADERIPWLLQTPAAFRWVSIEPMVGPIDLSKYLDGHEEHGVDLSRPAGSKVGCCTGWTPPLDQVVLGGESGPSARPMHPDWVRSVRDQCAEANVPYFFKQWGGYAPTWGAEDGILYADGRWIEGATHDHPDAWKDKIAEPMMRVPKSYPAMLDGKEHRELAWGAGK